MKAIVSLLLCIALQIVSVEILQAEKSQKLEQSTKKQKSVSGKSVARPEDPLQGGTQGPAKKSEEAGKESRAAPALEVTPGIIEGAAEEGEGGGEKERPSGGVEAEKPVLLQSSAFKQEASQEGAPLWMWVFVAALAVVVLVEGSLIGWQGRRNYRERLLQEIASKVESSELRGIATSLHKLGDISISLGSLLHELKSLSQQIGRSGTILNEINSVTTKIVSTLETLPSALGKEVSDAVQAQLRAEAEKVSEARISTLISQIREKIDAIRRDYPVINVAHEVRQMLLLLSSRSDLKSFSETSFTSYVELSDEWDTLLRGVARLREQKGIDLEGQARKMLRDAEVFEEKAAQLSQNHKPIWFIPFLEKAAQVPALSEKIDTLKNILGIEDIPVQVGAEAKNLRDFEVVSTEGKGRRSVVYEVVERGYREKATGTVIKPPKVAIRLEG